MDKDLYTQREIREYLLGSLTEAETERFDELSFTNDSFAEDLKAAENELVDDFVNGELTGETLEKFDSHYLVSPLRREKVEFARSLQVFAERKSAEMESTAIKKTSSGFFSSLISFISAKPLQISFAAGLFLLIAGGLWLVNRRAIQPETEIVVQNSPTPSPQIPAENSGEKEIAAAVNENIAPPNVGNKTTNKNVSTETNRKPQTEKPPVIIPPKPIVATFILAPQRRGANQLKTVSISKETTDVAAALQLESDDYVTYRVALTDESGEKNLWQSSVLKSNGAGENKTLNIRFPAKILKNQQVYSLTVSGTKDGAEEIISNYNFRIVIK